MLRLTSIQYLSSFYFRHIDDLKLTLSKLEFYILDYFFYLFFPCVFQVNMCFFSCVLMLWSCDKFMFLQKMNVH